MKKFIKLLEQIINRKEKINKNIHPITIYSLTAGGMVIFLGSICLLINASFSHFIGNNYFPENTVTTIILLGIMWIGLNLYLGSKNFVVRIVSEFYYYFLVMGVIVFATNAVQFTPFPPIDDKLIYLQSFVAIDMQKILAWTSKHTKVSNILILVYRSLSYQMVILPIIAMLTRKFNALREYYFLLLFSALLGFAFYYFFPTLAPASFIKSPYFFASQYATGIKFIEIHNHIPPSTMEGGMIALPSFHVIWAIFCIYLMREIHIIFTILLIVNLLLVISCVFLGWHYPIDILGSAIILWLSFKFLKTKLSVII